MALKGNQRALLGGELENIRASLRTFDNVLGELLASGVQVSDVLIHSRLVWREKESEYGEVARAVMNLLLLRRAEKGAASLEDQMMSEGKGDKE